jgi:hypothetical protein
MHLLHGGLSQVVRVIGDDDMRLRARDRDVDEAITLLAIEKRARRINRIEDHQGALAALLSSVVQFSAKVGFENSLVGGPFISFCRG